jgi:hypothetical protein
LSEYYEASGGFDWIAINAGERGLESGVRCTCAVGRLLQLSVADTSCVYFQLDLVLLAIEVDDAGVRVEFGFKLVGPTKLPMNGSGLGPVWTFRLAIIGRVQACLVCEAELELVSPGRAQTPRGHAKSERDLFFSEHPDGRVE